MKSKLNLWGPLGIKLRYLFPHTDYITKDVKVFHCGLFGIGKTRYTNRLRKDV